MNCQICSQDYSLQVQNRLPRVLVQCGHTFCHQCICNNLVNGRMICPQCSKMNFSENVTNFPINETLVAILKNSIQGSNPIHTKSQSSVMSANQNEDQDEICKLHNKKLQAYCEKDNELLCLNCVLSNVHKSHKISSVSEKVEKDKQILQKCYKKILKSKIDNQQTFQNSISLVEQLNLQYKEYVFEIRLLYKNIVSQLQQQQEKFILEIKKQTETAIVKIQSIQNQLSENKIFLNQLEGIYQEVISLKNVKYLNQDNKRIFIMQNCQSKMPKLEYKKVELNKLSILEQSLTILDQLIAFQKKKCQSKKKNSEKNKQKQLVAVQNGQSPSRFYKKNSTKNTHSKEPQILQVNLSQQYQKYKENKGLKKRHSEMAPNNSSLIKATKIQYQVKRQSKKGKSEKQKHSLNKSQKLPIPCNSNLQDSKGFKNINISQKSTKREFQLSIFDQSKNFSSPIGSNNSPERAFSVCTPLSINSFMESSQFTIKDSLKDSRSSFTICNYDQKIYHFGGLTNQSVSCTKLHDNHTQLIKEQGLNRNKCQCVILKSYSSKKILILGGKNINGQRTSSILEFDIPDWSIRKSLLHLQDAISGFGAVCLQNKMYVFGGSSSSPLNYMTQYQIGNTGFKTKRLAPMLNSRDQLGHCLGFDGFLYVCGGINSSNTILSSCQKYNFQKNKWVSIPAMKSPRRSFSMVSLPNGIFAIGGHDGKQFLNKVQMFDYQTQKWVQICSMIQPRFTHTSIATNDYQSIIVFGGFQNQALKTVEKYNVIEDKWKRIQDMDKQRFLHCSMFVQDS